MQDEIRELRDKKCRLTDIVPLISTVLLNIRTMAWEEIRELRDKLAKLSEDSTFVLCKLKHLYHGTGGDSRTAGQASQAL